MSKEVDDMNNKKYCIHGRSENQKCAKCNGMVDGVPNIDIHIREWEARCLKAEGVANKAKELCLKHQDIELDLRRELVSMTERCHELETDCEKMCGVPAQVRAEKAEAALAECRKKLDSQQDTLAAYRQADISYDAMRKENAALTALLAKLKSVLEEVKMLIIGPNGPLYGIDSKFIDRVEDALAMTPASVEGEGKV